MLRATVATMSRNRPARWPDPAAVAVLDDVVPEEPEVPAVALSSHVVLSAAEAANDAATYEQVDDYGWGGDLYSRDVVDNWSDIMTAALTQALASCSEDLDVIAIGGWPHGAYQIQDVLDMLAGRFGSRFVIDMSGSGPPRITPLNE